MSIITEIKKFNRKYTIITHMQDSALPADSEVLLEGVVIVYTPTGELKDAEKCKVGDGVTEFCNLPWLGDSIEVEDLTAELQRQDELLTSIETFLNSIKTTDPVPEPEPVEAMWYFTYNSSPGILSLENGQLIAAGDPWVWESTDGSHTFSISPDEGIALQDLDTSKVYKCINDAGSPGDYAELAYGIPEKAWRLFATEALATQDVAIYLDHGWSWPYIKEGGTILSSSGRLMAIYKDTGSGLGDYVANLDGSEETPYTFSLENLNTTETYKIYHDVAADSVHTFTLKYDYPAKPGGTVIVEFPTEWYGNGTYPMNTTLRLSVGNDTQLDSDQITVEFYDRQDTMLGVKYFTVASGTSVEFDFEGFGGEQFNANGEHYIVVVYSINGKSFNKTYSANWP